MSGFSGREQGISWIWVCAGAMVTIIMMIIVLFSIILVNGLSAFWPAEIYEVTTDSGTKVIGVPYRSFTESNTQDDGTTKKIRKKLIYLANLDFDANDFAYALDTEFKDSSIQRDLWFVERQEWGPFIGKIKAIKNSAELSGEIQNPSPDQVQKSIEDGKMRRAALIKKEHDELNKINFLLEENRIGLKSAKRKSLESFSDKRKRELKLEIEEKNATVTDLQAKYLLAAESFSNLKAEDEKHQIVFESSGGVQKSLPVSQVVRAFQSSQLNLIQKFVVYCGRVFEFVFAKPREANTAGGVWPAIFGTVTMTLLMSVVVMPVGVLTALYMREIAKQGILVGLVRVAVGNLAGVPSIVYGVFGLGFFCYILGSTIDEIFFKDILPTATFGTGGVLWASLTLALLTVPVVIVSTEEALSSVPRTLREASYGCGATRLQTLLYVVLPRAMPGVLTGLILAIARGVGEVAPLLVTGAVKLAPMLPIDGHFPYVHLQRSFMHLSFHIYDLGFQSRSTELTRPLVFATTTLLFSVVLILNFSAFKLRSHLRKRYEGRGAF